MSSSFPNDKVRRLPAFVSKAASEELGRNLVKLVAYNKASGGQTDPALTRFLSGLEARTLTSIVKIGLLAPDRVAVAKPLADHVTDFAMDLEARGNSSRHVELLVSRARKIVSGSGFKYHGDISASKVMEYLNGLRQDTKTRRGISAQTFNFYIGALKQFCKWMQKDRRAIENPVLHLDGLNVKTDRRRDRRALTVAELTNLLETTRHGPDREGMTGPERALLYLLAVETGLRSNELRTLTRASFDLGANPATVTVLASYSKHRREDTLPLRPGIVNDLASLLATMTPATQVFKIPTDRKKAAGMYQADLEATGIVFRDDAGLVADFHGLRHTFITNLANGGVHPKTAQALARHSTITLTMDRYTHSLHQDQSDALEALPDLSKAMQEPLQATGTDDGITGQKNLASCLALSNGPKGVLVASNGLSAGDLLQCENTGKIADSEVFPKRRRGGRAADCTGLENRRRRKMSASSNLAPSAWQSDADWCNLVQETSLSSGFFAFSHLQILASS